MRHVIVTDKNGWKTRYLLRDTDGDEVAQTIGVPDGPPDLRSLDWDQIMKDINNTLLDQGLCTWDQLMKNPLGLNIVCLPIKRGLSALYRVRREKKTSESSRK